ncbi:hypothetical protein RRG08_046837 [Elysia crispata]|uniref:Uncharacterized protein n=1 Tax=Elysia crispata TaxID=231223 RepID=A0AAE0ZN55_9GAST|nr:hypothetical protein RRG08_046837 [Elysia crispata]
MCTLVNCKDLVDKNPAPYLFRCENGMVLSENAREQLFPFLPRTSPLAECARIPDVNQAKTMPLTRAEFAERTLEYSSQAMVTQKTIEKVS